MEDIQSGDFAVVETSRGQQLGEVVELLDEGDVKQKSNLKPISRRATPRDLVLRQVWEYKEKEAVEACRSKLKELKIKGVKIIAAEYTFDGKRLTFMYNSEGDESVDLSKLMKELKNHFRRTRIDMRQIGPRDVAKEIGGMGVCGMGIRCCSLYLTDFQPISIRMAKTQGVSLAPSEITGMCGRLRCCLGYENEAYIEARKSMPREKDRIDTPFGEGKVIGISPLIKSVNVLLEDGNIKEITLAELEGEPVSEESDEQIQTAMDEETQSEISSEKKRRSFRRKGRRRPIKRRKKK